jgi:hypothetical protein
MSNRITPSEHPEVRVAPAATVRRAASGSGRVAKRQARRSPLPLPKYTRRWPLAGGRWGYYFTPPTWALKPKGDDDRGPCPVAVEALGTDRTAAIERVNKVLLPLFDFWRSRGRVGHMSNQPQRGTLDWLIETYRGNDKFKGLGRKTRALHKRGFRLVGDFVLEGGCRFGQMMLGNIDATIVDKLHEALLPLRDESGKPVPLFPEGPLPEANGVPLYAERRTSVNHAINSCRTAWNVVHGLWPKEVPAVNPFGETGLAPAHEAETSMPAAGNTPGLKFRKIKDGRQPYWVAASVAKDTMGFPDRTVRLPREASEEELAKLCHGHTARLRTWIADQRTGNELPATRTLRDGSFRSLSRIYQEHPRSEFHKIERSTRENYVKRLDFLERDIGHWQIRKTTALDVVDKFDEWGKPEIPGGPERIHRGHDAISMFRTVIRFIALLGDRDCQRLAGELQLVRFRNAAPRKAPALRSDRRRLGDKPGGKRPAVPHKRGGRRPGAGAPHKWSYEELLSRVDARLNDLDLEATDKNVRSVITEIRKKDPNFYPDLSIDNLVTYYFRQKRKRRKAHG